MKDARKGSRFPFLTTLGAMLPGVSDKQTWEREYATGAWDGLGVGNDADRYAIILGHLIRRQKPSSLLDVGCGSGQLLAFASHAKLTHYTGVDISEEAIKIAQKHATVSSDFAASTAEAFHPTRRYDVIVFNEVVFYLKDPRAVLERYQQHLEPGGSLLVSMVDCPLARWLWHKLGRSFRTVHRTQVGTGGALSWTIRALEPKAA